MSDLDDYEQELLQAYERGEFESERLSSEQLEEFKAAAVATFAYDQHVDVCLSQSDLLGLRLRAAREGIPYQALMASVLHKFVTGQLSEKSA